ncbi:hypothetical protein BB559_000848 [Furculomyces boomerangus]|uniref:DUF7707 domain-containing protein n=2 Tax=Harpellales TaxID=61421 RepID=A0A2T9Z3W2_9FUNG|nr:hypothetical protein BB559_000848 [Furculomyces boomerangus]PWA03377.1 hypothetical protein BB558_000457 [Smittium angustum]
MKSIIKLLVIYIVFVTFCLCSSNSTDENNSVSQDYIPTATRPEKSKPSPTQKPPKKNTEETKKPTKKDDEQSMLDGVKKTWCNDNANFCTNVCLNITAGMPVKKSCNYKSLEWSCVCGNGTVPDLRIFTFPVDYYKCTAEVSECQKQCGSGNSACTVTCSNSKNCTAPNDPYAGQIAKDVDPKVFGSNDTSTKKDNGFVNHDYLFNDANYNAQSCFVLMAVMAISILLGM